MKNLLRWILPVLVLAAGTALTLWLIAARPEIATERKQVAAPLVRTQPAESVDAQLIIESSGSVRPRSELRVVAEVEGRVTSVSPRLEAGAFVSAGELLVEIDRRDYELALVRAQAELARARAGLLREEAEAEVAAEQWADLGRGEPTPLALREPQLAEAQAGLLAAQAALADAELDLERTALRAPFDARVRSKQVDVGQFVSRAGELARLYPVDRAEVLLPVADSELYALDLSTGEAPEVELSADFAGARRTWQGRIVRSEGEVDAANRSVRLVAEVLDPFALRLEPGEQRVPLELGLFVQASILGRTLPDHIRLPRSALRGADEVFVIDAQDRLRRRRVQIARRERDVVYVESGLEAGERVCLSPLDAPVDGMRVRVFEEPSGSATEVQR